MILPPPPPTQVQVWVQYKSIPPQNSLPIDHHYHWNPRYTMQVNMYALGMTY